MARLTEPKVVATKKGDTPTPPPAPSSPFDKKTNGTKSSFGKSNTTTSAFDKGSTVSATPAVSSKPTDTAIGKAFTDAFNGTLNAGQTILNTALAPLYFVEGSLNQLFKSGNVNKPAGYDKMTAEQKRQVLFDRIHGKVAKSADEKNLTNNPVKAIGDILNAGASNAAAPFQNKPTITGKDINKSLNIPSNFATDLTTDILLDPLTYVDGIGAVTHVLGAIKTGGETALKAGKIAATSGQVSKHLVVDSADQTGKKLKIGADTFNQYTKKPLLKENLRTGEKFNKLKTKIDTKYTYETALGDKTVRNVLSSAIEAGAKATATRALTKFAAKGITSDLSFEAKLARRAATIAAKQEKPQAIIDGIAKDIQPFEMHTHGRNTYVMDEANTIHKFPSQKTAKQFIADQGTAPAKIKPAVKVDRPILDTAPTSPTIGMSKLGDTTIEESQKALKTIDKIVAKTKGLTAGGKDIASKVNDVLHEATAVKTVTTNLNAYVKAGLKNVQAGKTSPISLLQQWATLGGQQASLAAELGKKTIITSAGEKGLLKTLVDTMSRKNITWDKLPESLQKQVLAHFAEFMGTKTATEAQYLAKLTTLVGKDIAEKIAATGVLSGKDFSAKTVMEIVNNLPGSSVEKTYKTIEEFVTGLRNGDIVDISAITGILKAIDPEAKLTASVDKALSQKDSYTQLRNILITDGVQTIEQTANRLNLINAEKLFKSQGLAMSDIAASYANARLTGTAPIQAVQESLRQAAAGRLAQYMGSGQMNDAVNITLRAIARGLESNFEYMQKEIFASENVFEGLSTFGDLAVRNTEKAFQADTKAALLKQVNQSGEARMVGQLLGLIRRRYASKTVKGQKIDLIPNTKDIFNDFIAHSSIMDDAMLSVLGARNIYQKAVQGSKGVKHYIYFTMGDYARLMRSTGAEDLATRSLIADMSLHNATKMDTLSTIGIGQAIRTTIEQFEKNGSVVKNDIIKLLKSRGERQGARSTAYESQVDQLVNDIADHITTPKFIAEVQKVHNLKASASIEDSLNAAESLTNDMYTALIEGWKANRMTGIDNAATRAQLARDWFNKFAYASGIFAQQSGEQAQAVFQAASRIFVTEGKLKALADDAEQAWLIGSPAKSAGQEANTLYADVMDAINSYFKHQNKDSYAGAGRERLPFPTQASKGKATDLLTQAKLNYEQIIETGKNLTTKAQVASWNKKFATAQSKLDVARLEAWKNSVPTQHWDNGKWVPTETYDHAAALARNTEQTQQIVLDGLAQKAKNLDTPAAIPGYKKLTPAESQKWLENWRNENNVKVITRTEGVQEEVASKILDDQNSFEALNLNPSEQADRLHEAEIHDTMQEATIYAPVYESATNYAGAKTLPTGIRTGTELQPMKPVMGKYAATAGRQDVQPVLSRMESAAMLGMAKVGDIMHTLRKTYNGNVTPEEFASAFRMALSHADAPEGLSSTAQDLAMHLRNVVDSIIDSAEKQGLDPEHLKNAFKRFGIGKDQGFMDVGTMNPGDLLNYFKELPFAEMPAAMKGTAGAEIWAKRAEDFAKTGEDPFAALTKLMNAVQFTAYEQRMIADFSTKFSYKAQGLTMQQALAQGFVKIKGVGSSGTDLSILLPKAEQGGLYPPYIAEQFMSLNREYNRIFNEKMFKSPAVNTFIRNAMELQGFLKATQTIFRAGHHITNMVGDSSTAWISGTRDPRDWARGLQIALRFASEDIKSKWGQSKLGQKFNELYQTTGQYGHKVTRNAGTDEAHITVAHRNTAGKLVATRVSFDDIYPMLRERNLVMGNIYANDLQGLYDSVLSDATEAVGPKATLAQQKLAKVREGLHTIEEPFGSFSSWYSNIPRIATAIRVIESRSWKNMNEALDAAVTEVNRFHPTIQSLSATERKNIRPIFTYYTWLRGAHYAFIDMAIHHTAAMTLFSKAQYNNINQQGYQPTNIGNPWAQNTAIPNYIDYSVYGPQKGIGGEPMLFKASFLAQDVLDTWKFSYDPAYGVFANAQNNVDAATRTIMGSTALIAKPGLTQLTGVDPATGRPSKVDSFATLADAATSNFGFMNLYKGLGGQTFAQQAGEAPLSSEGEKQLWLTNWITGQRQQRILSPANIKNARIENSQRTKAIVDRMKKAK
jgi:hypothetical protein